MCARGKGFGTLIKRGKYWQCKITVDGVNHYKATGTDSKVKAKKILEEFARPFQNKTEIERLAAVEAKIQVRESELSESEGDYSNIPLTDILETYYGMANARKIASKTMVGYERFLNKLISFVNDNFKDVKIVRDVSKMVVEKYLEYLKPSVSAGYFNCSLALFKKIWKEFGRFSKHRCFRENPWEGYKYKTADSSVKRPLTSDEIARIFAVIDNPDTRLLFTLGLYTGMRIGDCCKLKWESIDMERRLINVVPMKTRRHGTKVVLPIHQVLFEELDSLRKALPETPSDNPLDEYVSKKLAQVYDHRHMEFVRDVFIKAGISTTIEADGKKRIEVSFHSLRHTMISMATSSGVPIEVVREISGHTSDKMCRHYSHINAEALTKAINAIPDIGCRTSTKALVEIDSDLMKELNSMGLTAEEAIRELVSMKKNTITVKTEAA